MTQRTLTDAEITAYRQDGVVLVKRAIDPDLVPRMIAAVERAPGEDPHRRLPRTSTGMNRHLYPTDPEFRSLRVRHRAGPPRGPSHRERDDPHLRPAVREGRAHTDEDGVPLAPRTTRSGRSRAHPDLLHVGGADPRRRRGQRAGFVRGGHRSGITYRPYFGGPTDIEQLNRMWPNFGAYVASFPHEIERARGPSAPV
ncbi:MAG: hypothetical protein R2749_22410 [Acidimicrobiales bacterium]